LPPRTRQEHGKALLRQLERVREEAVELGRQKTAFGVDAGNGLYLQFESEPDFELKFDSLDAARSHIELLAVKQIGNKTIATCFVPEGKLAHFFRLVEKYLREETKTGKPKNRDFLESVSEIRRAVLEGLWTDEDQYFPTTEDAIWWEVWLRAGDDRVAILELFKRQATEIGLETGTEQSRFPDRTVILVRGTKSQMSKSVDLLNCIAEVRKPKETADFFTAMPPREQLNWIRSALERLRGPERQSPAICILDTGVNNEHPLLRPALNPEDMHSYEPVWNVADRHGHGTEMAGLSLYGDLVDVLTSNSPIELKHRLESVKILPPAETDPNPPHLYGAITKEAIARAEVTAPGRQRTVCMAVTTKDFRDRGQPSSWSAALDALASGAEDEVQRLIVVSAGNTDPGSRHLYPNNNETDGIHDPGQSWNAVTVGAFTQKGQIDAREYPDWRVIAPHGDLSPSSCTSLIWQRPWPVKPDVVFEGGNMAIDPASGEADSVDSLCLLTTHWRVTEKPLIVTGETSAATALVARMAAIIQAQYPELWPETIRALLIHSSDWTEAIKARFAPFDSRTKWERLLRYCGYGVPNLDKALWSARNSLTLVCQDSLQPFDRDGHEYKCRDLNLHRIPWPTEVLQGLGESQAEMKVTLSYFIEPNPARRGWTRKHRYASHGLRFEAKTPTETVEEFRGRVNKAARDEESGKVSASDSRRWQLGPDLRTFGSVHSDSWAGTAAELASRGYVAVYPVIGWWRERHQLGKWNKRVRYSLAISIKTPGTEVDIYTPIVNMIKTQVLV
jgi:hypothetical protein